MDFVSIRRYQYFLKVIEFAKCSFPKFENIPSECRIQTFIGDTAFLRLVYGCFSNTRNHPVVEV